MDLEMPAFAGLQTDAHLRLLTARISEEGVVGECRPFVQSWIAM
jgi:hypothetical protein